MEQQDFLHDTVDNVPLSSSPASSLGLEGETTTHVQSNIARPFSPSPSADCPSVESTTPETNHGVKVSDPLLSPFAIVNSQSTPNSENAGIHPTALQRALDSFPTSSEDAPLPSESSRGVSLAVADVLQSPFGINLKNASTLPNDVFLPSTPDNISSTKGSISDTNVERDACIEDDTRRNANDSSDSGESTATITKTGVPSTPKSPKSMHDIPSSSPYFVTESTEKDSGEAICVDLTIADCHAQAAARKGQLQASDRSTKLSSVDSEELFAIMNVSSETTSLDDKFHASPVEEVPSSKGSSDAFSPGTVDHNAISKRTRDVDDKEPVPAPKRMTLASQQKQHKKLASPFRSPLLSKPDPRVTGAPDREHARASSASVADKSSTPKNPPLSISAPIPRSRTPLSTTARAKAQFKSPLMSSTSIASSSRVSNTRTIQELERKVQLLKRATKIKRDEEEEKLEQLVKKWRLAGREAAWELWRFVRDNDETSDAPYPGTNAQSSGDSFSRGWGWADTAGSARSSSWGWDKLPEKETHEDDTQSEELESPTKLERELFDSLRRKSAIPRTTILPPTPRGAYFEERDDELECNRSEDEPRLDAKEKSQGDGTTVTQPKSLGTMLHQLGIAHDTLGWVEDEGDFVDV